jgi:hypothetical protein
MRLRRLLSTAYFRYLVQMHTSRLALLGLTIACFSAQESFGATYYVSRVTSAADTNEGTSASRPWRTISAAAQRVQPGDTVVVLSGDYRDEDVGYGLGVIPITVSGTKQRPIRFFAPAGQLPIVKHLLLTEVQHVVVQGFTVQGPRFTAIRPTWRDMPVIVRDRPASELAGVNYLDSWVSRQPLIEQAFATYFALIQQLEYLTGIDLVNCQDVDLVENKIDGYWAGIQFRGARRIEVVRNEISHCYNGIFTWQPAPGLQDSFIANNQISQSLDNGIDIREGSKNVIVAYNKIRHSGRSHISVQNSSEGCLIRYNDVASGGYYSESMHFPGSSAISLNGCGNGNVVEGNEIVGQIDLTEVDGNGIILDLLPQGVTATVRYNWINRNMGSGLNTTDSPNNEIYGNAFLYNGYAGTNRRNGAGIKLSRDEDIGQTIQFNLFFFNRTAGILSYRIMDRQRRINRNSYFYLTTPLIWDGFADNERAYHTINEVRASTGWETNGMGVGLP